MRHVVKRIFIRPKRQAFLVLALFQFCGLAPPIDAQVFTPEDQEEEFVQENPNDPIELFNKGQIAHAKGDLTDALELYLKAVRERPEFPEALFQIGMIYQEQGKISESDDFLTRAAASKPNWALPIVELGKNQMSRGDFSKAERFLKNALAIEPNNLDANIADAHLKLATNASQQKLEVVKSKLRDLLEKNNHGVSAKITLARIDERLGHFKEARQLLIDVLKSQPDNITALREMVEIQIALGENELAIANARKIFELEPNVDSSKLLLSRALVAGGKSVEALAVLGADESSNSDIRNIKNAIIADKIQDIPTLERLLKDNEDNVFILGRLCILNRVSNPQNALSYCSRALTLDKSNINHAIGYGAALVQLRKFPEAISIFRNLLRHSPEDFALHANLATALFEAGHFLKAKSEYLWIIKQKPDIPITYYFLGISHDRLREFPEALENYKMFLKIATMNVNMNDNRLEIEKVNLRLPVLEKLIKSEN